MQSYTNHPISLEHHRQRLESLVQESSYVTAYHPKQVTSLFTRAMQGLTQWLTTGNMPRISKAMQGDREVWKVYDPISAQTQYFEEENALRAWMEQRYYQ